MMYSKLEGSIYKKTYCHQLMTMSELIELRDIVNKTIAEYDKQNINDEYVLSGNNITKSAFKACNRKKTTPIIYGKDVYLIHNISLNILKIGITNDVYKRYATIKNQDILHEYDLLYSIKNKSEMEGILHDKYKDLRLYGEWFEYSDEIINEFINASHE